MTTTLADANWLRNMAKEDDDVRAALFAAYRQFGVSNISEFAKQQPKELRVLAAAMRDMLVAVDEMAAADEALRERRETWRSA